MISFANLSKMNWKNKLIYFIAGASLIGFLDSLYLSASHYSQSIHCSVISGCQEVLASPYSEIMGIPIAFGGVIFYLFILINALLYLDNQNKWSFKALVYIPIFGFLFSLYLTYLQIFVIGSVCQYCLLSALSSTFIFITGIILLKKKEKNLPVK